MSSRRIRASLLVGIAAALAAPASAQVGTTVAEAARTVDSLRAVVARERASLRSVAPPHRVRSGLVAFLLDTTRISDLTLGILRQAAQNASTAVLRTHGSMAARTLGALEIVVAESRPDGGRRPVLSLHVRGWPDSEGWFTRSLPLPAHEIEDYLVTVASTSALAFADSSLSRWTGRYVPARSASEISWRDVSVWLASAQSEVARRCVAARVDACASALELEPTPNRLAAWYVPGDYPALVEHWTGWARTDSLTRADATRCVQSRETELCARVVQAVTIGDLLPAGARRSFFALALESGGPRALERLAATRGPVRLQLAAAAGVPADSLLALWQARVMASRPNHLLAGPALATLGWTLLFAVASLRRPRCG